MANPKDTNLHFDVSTGLKSVLGSDLITNDEVAIFELVKNSFDAGATEVNIYFGNETIIVADNGSGMSYDDITKKWLFVAYSSKKELSDSPDFRDDIAERKHYAGSKGIGRFSSDRLGREINLQTRSENSVNGVVHSVEVDWDKFDKDYLQKFEKIKVEYNAVSDFVLPPEIQPLQCGTVITIRRTRRNWTRQSILAIKADLAKLINPFGSAVDGFQIIVHSPSEKVNDDLEKLIYQEKDAQPIESRLVNGPVGNFIFATLQDKTTFIRVHIDVKTDSLESELIDRGELIYKTREPNIYPKLKDSDFSCQLYFLNTSAKMTFARRMGVPSVQFGSVFLFRNGFRVFPVGEDGDDWFKIDRRKQQGYARFLGTREIIGRIDVSGSEADFKEASSRNTGLIETEAVSQLRSCFKEFCLKRLERYIVPVTYVDKEDRNTDDLSRLMTDPGRARVASVVANLVDNKEVELLEYSRSLIGIINERSAQFETSLISLRAIAEKTKDKNLFENIEEAEKRFDEIRKSEEAARRQADEERAAKKIAEEKVKEVEKLAVKISAQLEEEKKRSLFLTSMSTLDFETIVNLHHQVTIYSVDIQRQIENFFKKTVGQTTVSLSDVTHTLERVALLNKKVMGVSKFATKANFRLQSEKIQAKLSDYIEQYINDVAKQFLMGSLAVNITQDNKGFIQKFNPIDVSIVIDNLISNSRKKNVRATKISFDIVHPTKDTLYIQVTDNGKGFSSEIEPLDRIFEKGFTLSDGSGLGLYHVRHVLGEMNGTIEASRRPDEAGACFLIRISK